MSPNGFIITTQSILFKPDPWSWSRALIPKGEVLPVLEIYEDRVSVEFEGTRVGLLPHLFKPYPNQPNPPVAL